MGKSQNTIGDISGKRERVSDASPPVYLTDSLRALVPGSYDLVPPTLFNVEERESGQIHLQDAFPVPRR